MEIKHSNNSNMFQRFLRAFTCSILFLGVTTLSLFTAQTCADTRPTIAGAKIVSNNQTGVIYSDPEYIRTYLFLDHYGWYHNFGRNCPSKSP